MITHIIQRTLSGLSTREDHDRIEGFFKDKDTSKFDMGLAQTLETISTKAAWLEVSLTTKN